MLVVHPRGVEVGEAAAEELVDHALELWHVNLGVVVADVRQAHAAKAELLGRANADVRFFGSAVGGLERPGALVGCGGGGLARRSKGVLMNRGGSAGSALARRGIGGVHVRPLLGASPHPVWLRYHDSENMGAPQARAATRPRRHATARQGAARGARAAPTGVPTQRPR